MASATTDSIKPRGDNSEFFYFEFNIATLFSFAVSNSTFLAGYEFGYVKRLNFGYWLRQINFTQMFALLGLQEHQ